MHGETKIGRNSKRKIISRYKEQEIAENYDCLYSEETLYRKNICLFFVCIFLPAGFFSMAAIPLNDAASLSVTSDFSYPEVIVTMSYKAPTL